MGAYLAVAIGGALGSVARLWLVEVTARLLGPELPWGTLAVNVLGSLVIGIAAAVTPAHWPMPELRPFVMAGLCGGFTTFSAFSLQTLELVQTGQPAWALAYVLGSVVLCLVATWLGYVALSGSSP